MTTTTPTKFNFTTDQFSRTDKENSIRFVAEASCLRIPPGVHLPSKITLTSSRNGKTIPMETDWNEETDGEFWKYHGKADGKEIIVTIWND